MATKQIAQGDLLFHAVHGVCRVDEIDRESSTSREVLSYALVPNNLNRMKVRFVVPLAEMKPSGFHTLISPKEAQGILDSLKDGDFTPNGEEPQAGELAKVIFTSSREDLGMKDARKRQVLERSARGLVGELAFVLKMTLKEMTTSVKKSLGDPSRISPALLAALTHASEG